MANSIQERFQQWKFEELLIKYPGLSLRPSSNGYVRIVGSLSFAGEASGFERIEDTYALEILVPSSFPRTLAGVRETAGRIPKSFHTNDDGTLCLGSPLRQKLELAKEPTLLGFVRTCLIPYLYGYSHREQHGSLPFGELEHGREGLRKDFTAFFGLGNDKAAEQMVWLTGMKKREANKYPCPCESGRRLGKCHNREVNRLRTQLGRAWLRGQYRWLVGR
jgi:hypothetical protein